MINLPTNTIYHQVKINKNILERIPRDKISNGIYVFTGFTSQNQKEFKEIRSKKEKKCKKKYEALEY